MTSFKKRMIGAITAITIALTGATAFAAGEDSDNPLYAKGKLPEHSIGNPDAKVVMIEYASFTCPHCGNFHNNTLKQFKKDYVDSGKVKFIFRNFHLDNLALAGAMLAECAPADQYYNIVDLLFTNQNKWLRSQNQFEEMKKLVQLAGYSDDKIKACFANKDLISGLIDDRTFAAEQVKIAGTPSVFINGEKTGGAVSYAELKAIVDPLLEAK